MTFEVKAIRIKQFPKHSFVLTKNRRQREKMITGNNTINFYSTKRSLKYVIKMLWWKMLPNMPLWSSQICHLMLWQTVTKYGLQLMCHNIQQISDFCLVYKAEFLPPNSHIPRSNRRYKRSEALEVSKIWYN